MSLQWTAVATFLYAEVFLVLLLCVPFVSPARWQKIFRSRLVGLAVTYGNRCFIVLIIILVLLLLDALRDSRRYELAPGVALQGHPGALEHLHMRRFRAQRNLYLAGFALLLAFLLRRLVALISQQALLGASSEAFRRQAEGASLAARRYLQDNDALRQQLQGSGGAEGSSTPSEENKTLRAKVEKLREELESSKRSLQKAEGELQAMRSQAEGLSREYDRLLEEHQRLGGAQADPKQKKLQ